MVHDTEEQTDTCNGKCLKQSSGANGCPLDVSGQACPPMAIPAMVVFLLPLVMAVAGAIAGGVLLPKEESQTAELVFTLVGLMVGFFVSAGIIRWINPSAREKS